MKIRTCILVAAPLLAVPSVASANAGTPLLWALGIHLVIGNLVIGALEGFLLALLFKRPVGYCIGLMIMANYLSAWIGVSLVNSAAYEWPQMNLNNLWSMIWVMVLASYVTTLIIEYPFVFAALRRVPSGHLKAILGSLIIQTASYIILFVHYRPVSDTSLITQNQIVAPSSMDLPQDIQLYFISDEDGDVHVRSLTSPESRRIFDLNSTDLRDRLHVSPRTTENKSWNLLAGKDDLDKANARHTLILSSFATDAAPESLYVQQGSQKVIRQWPHRWAAPKLGDARSSPLEFGRGFWPTEGMRLLHDETEVTQLFAFAIPLAIWEIRNLTHLPGDKVLLQLGRDQICIYDHPTRRIALLARGRGPVAAIGPPIFPSLPQLLPDSLPVLPQ